METITIRPLSANRAWKGQRFKSDDYKKYEIDLGFILPRLTLPPAPYEVYYEFGVATKASDGDNCIKQFQDCLTHKYKFNDNDIFKWTIIKKVVGKGNEYIKFEIKTL